MAVDIRRLRVGTRGSCLALAQTRLVCQALSRHFPELSLQTVVIRTQGDRGEEFPLESGKGVFVREIEEALLRGQVDLAVHSLKDLPVEEHPELTIAATPRREDARDLWVSRQRIEFPILPASSIIATGSLRRRVQLELLLPKARFVPIRGNIETRIRKLFQNPDWTGTVIALAAWKRLGKDLGDVYTSPLPYEIMLPAAGQGALAVQTRRDNQELQELLQRIHDPATEAEVKAERAFLLALGGGCRAPIAAKGTAHGERLFFEGFAKLPGWTEPRKVSLWGESKNPEALGKQSAWSLIESMRKG
jgi:hydroxymethylbilane synthase